MNIESRLRALESKLSIISITLTMSDGTTRQIPADCLLEVMGAGMSQAWAERTGNPVPESRYSDVLQLVRDSVNDNSAATGNGELVNLIRVLCAGPVETESEGNND